MIGLRGCGVLCWLGLVAYLVDPNSMRWAALGLPAWARLTGVPIGAVGAVWTLWTLRTLGPNLTDTVAVRPNATLVTKGPYRWVRHPFYLGVAALVTAMSLLASNGFLVVGSIAVLTLLSIRTRVEEARLVDRFGDAYRDYAARTGRFWPRRA